MITTNFSLRRPGERGGREKKKILGGALIDYTNLLVLNGLTLSGVLLRGASAGIHIPTGKRA